MTKTDKTYNALLNDIIENGVEKDTRAGRVKSVFGRQLRFDLKMEFPILTTKKVFSKGVIYELLWFLQRPYNSHGSMNIEYLVRNGVHIWDDDAYRWFKNDIAKHYKDNIMDIYVCTNDDEKSNFPFYEYWMERDVKLADENWLENITKEEFLDLVLQKVELQGKFMSKYRFGDLGEIYGAQWRNYNADGVDQINNIIKTLKTNPNDRRMVCLAYNPCVLDNIALPPCHVMMQFYTRELTDEELYEIKRGGKYEKIPKYALSCMWTQRSCDCCAGIPFNIFSYALLTHMIAKIVNMVPDELVASLGDCHIYLNHMDGANEQLSRYGSNVSPQLKIKGKQKCIDDFKFEDFEIIDYHPDPAIKYPLNVGM